MEKKIARMISVFLILAVAAGCFVTAGTARAEKIGKGARIIVYGEPGRSRSHMGVEKLGYTEFTAEPTQDAELTDIQFTTSDSSVCSVEKKGDYWLTHRKKEGTAVITMTCKADGERVERRLLVSSLSRMGGGKEIKGIIKKDTTVYYGASDQEGITTKDTEVKGQITADTEIVVAYQCEDFYRVELKNGTFGDSGEYWAYVRKSRVVVPLTGIRMEEERTCFEGESGKLDPVREPYVTTETGLNYQSSNTNVVTVDAKGNFRAAGTGTAVITVSSVQKPACCVKCRVTVKPYIPVTGIRILPAELDIRDGTKGKLEVQVLPEDASRKEFTIESADDAMLSLQQDGQYKAGKPGKTTVTATTGEGGFQAVCPVTIRPVAATGVRLQSNAELDTGESRQLVWSMIPGNASNKKVTWSSQNPLVAAVDQKGVVTGGRVGTTVIRIRTVDGGFTAACQIRVEQYPSDIRLTDKPDHLTLGKSMTLKTVMEPAAVTKKKLVWRTSKKSVISVTDTGRITAKKTGEAKILVYDRYTGAFDFCMIEVGADLGRPKLKLKKKKKICRLTWKKVKRATNYVIYRYDKKKGKFVREKSVGRHTLSCKISRPVKGSRFKIRAYYKPGKEYSCFSDEIRIR